MESGPSISGFIPLPGARILAFGRTRRCRNFGMRSIRVKRAVAG